MDGRIEEEGGGGLMEELVEFGDLVLPTPLVSLLWCNKNDGSDWSTKKKTSPQSLSLMPR